MPKKYDYWEIKSTFTSVSGPDEVILRILKDRGLQSDSEIKNFLTPPHISGIGVRAAGIDEFELKSGVARIRKAIASQESIIVYADYDADGITAGTVMWEVIHALGGRVMPYIPNRVDEGYGLSEAGIDYVKKHHDASLIVTVDHGITARDKVQYAKKKGIDVIITDHHAKPDRLPEAPIIHTTETSGSVVSWMIARELSRGSDIDIYGDLLAIASIGAIADMIPIVGFNRSLVSSGLCALRSTNRVGIIALYENAGIPRDQLNAYHISHAFAPRLNAMGRLTDAMEALRLLCTKQADKARKLAAVLGETNRERQQLTADTTLHATGSISDSGSGKIIVIGDVSYNQGIIGLVAGKLVEAHFRPAVVLSVGPEVSKASARSIPGFDITRALREVSHLLLEVGGHPMAAGFSVKTANIDQLKIALTEIAAREITPKMLRRALTVDALLPLSGVSGELWEALEALAPYGIGNYEPVFASNNVTVSEARTVGSEGKHLKLKVSSESGFIYDAIAFGFGDRVRDLTRGSSVNLAYTIDMNEWNGRRSLQLKVKDLR